MLSFCYQNDVSGQTERQIAFLLFLIDYLWPVFSTVDYLQIHGLFKSVD